MSDDDGGNGGAKARGLHIKTARLTESGLNREDVFAHLRNALRPSLVIVAGPDVGTSVTLDRSVEIGRDATADVALRDQSVSWRHVRIEDRGGGEWVVVDLASTNGTKVNGHRAAEAALKPGDRISLGKTILEFQLADAIHQGYAAEVQRLLHQDDLSGLWVRRRFDAQLETTVSAVIAASMPVVSVVVMDMDGIKAINDTHGHHMGAFAIGAAGRVIGRVLGDRGFATRFGGDEFAAAIPGAAKPDAVALAEEIRQAVVAHVYEKDGVRVHPGISCGVATLPGDARDADELFRAADKAMYRAKKGGKNRVSI